MVVGVAAQKEMLSRDIMDVKQDLGKQIQNVKEELKEDIRGVKNELKHLGRRQTELEIRDMALAQQWLMDRVNANR